MVRATRPEQLLGKPALEVIHPDFHRLAHERLRKHYADQPVPADEMKIVRLDGTTVDVEIASVALDIHGHKEVHAIARDITGRKKAEESLRLLGSAVEQSKESIVITEAELDLPGPKIIFVNPAFTAMTGYTAEEAIGKTPRILQGPRTDKAVLSRLRQNLQQGEPFTGEAINYRKDGTEYVQEWQIAPLRNDSGKITHFVSVQRDITARKAAELALRESEERFKFVARAISDALWGYSGQHRLVERRLLHRLRLRCR
jgi:PAS domain S-box-containing protein